MRTFTEEVGRRILETPGIQQAAGTADVSGAIMDETVANCTLNTSSCGMAEFAKGNVTNVFPGGKTRCIFGDEFFFRVFPGASDKLLIHLDGGGACWDEVTTVMTTTCVTNCIVRPMYGAFNTCPGGNPFDGYTVIFVPHCSGDMHVGNVARPWTPSRNPDANIEQRGLLNFRSVLDWAKANMAPKLAHLAFSGESAGAIGMKMWTPTVLRALPHERASVLADSYIGIFPDNFQGGIFKDFGVCDAGLLDGEMQEKCQRGEATIPEVFNSVIKEFPGVTFGSLNSKQDASQVMFFGVAVGSQRVRKAKAYCGDVDPDECDLSAAPPDVLEEGPSLDGVEYHRRIEEVIEMYSQNPNYVSYLQSAGSHTLLPFTFGNCSYLDYSNVLPGTYFLDGRDGAQRWSIQNWTRHFFNPAERRKSSACERFTRELDDDDYCRDKQVLHEAM